MSDSTLAVGLDLMISLTTYILCSNQSLPNLPSPLSKAMEGMTIYPINHGDR